MDLRSFAVMLFEDLLYVSRGRFVVSILNIREGLHMKTNKIPLILTIISLFSLSAVSAYPWSRDDDFKSLAEKFIDQDTITYCVSLGGANPEQAVMSLDDLAEQFEIAFREWTVGVANTIENSPRAEELKDISKLLRKKVELKNIGLCNEKFVDRTVRGNQLRYFTIPFNETQPDFGIFNSFDKCIPSMNKEQQAAYGSNAEIPLAFSFKEGPFRYLCIHKGDWNSSRMSGPRKAFDEYKKTNAEKLNCKFNSREQTFPMILHEVGHHFGLGDEYDPTDTASQNKKREKTYSVYTKEPGYGIMNFGTEITWDDIEGLITSFDQLTGTKRTINPTLRDIKFKKGKVAIIMDGKEVYVNSPAEK